MTVISIEEFRARRRVRVPEITDDPYLCGLEAQIIAALAHQVLTPATGPAEARATTRIRAVYLAYRRDPVTPTPSPDIDRDAQDYLDQVLWLLRGMDPRMVARLVHPSRERNRRAQQDVIEAALGIRRETS